MKEDSRSFQCGAKGPHVWVMPAHDSRGAPLFVHGANCCMDSEVTCVSDEFPLALRSATIELYCGVTPTTAPFQREQSIDRIQLWPEPENGVPSGQKMMQRAASLRVNQTGLWNPVMQTPYRFFKSGGFSGGVPAERHLWHNVFVDRHRASPRQHG